MILELQGIAKRFDTPTGTQPVEVFKGIELEIEEGESVAIVGPSGSGKSTLLNLIGALDRPTAGRILFEGKNLTEFAEREAAHYRNRTVGFVFQLHHLLPQCSVLENVLVPTLAEASRDSRIDYGGRAKDLLGSVGLEHRIHHRPSELSGGEQQRAAVARALINHPRLLLADEPTGSLDAENSNSLANLLVSLNESEAVTLIMVTHASDVAQRMSRVYKLDGGTLQ